jgi:diacylglycerol kinase (ATP)
VVPGRILLVRNDKARQGHRCDEVRSSLEARGITVVERGNHHPSLAIVLCQDKLDAVVVAGGDGTINAAAKGLVETGLPLGIIPLGTANDLARTLGLPSTIEEAVAVIANGKSRRVDLGTANDQHFFNVASVGLSARIAADLAGRRKGLAGTLPYALAALRSLRSSGSFHATIAAADQVHEIRTMQISVGNGRHYGGGLTIDSDASLQDATLHVVSFEPRRWWGLLPALPFLRSGRLEGRHAIRTLKVQRLEIRTRRPYDVDLDGDLLTQTPVVFGVLPGAIRVFVPAKSS